MAAPRLYTNLRQLRERADLSIRDAAGVLGIDKGTLSRIERGLQMPSEDQYERLRVEFPEARWWLEVA